LCCHISANTALRFAARPLAADADCKTHFVFAPSQFTARPPVVVAECGTCRILALPYLTTPLIVAVASCAVLICLCAALHSQFGRQPSNLCARHFIISHTFPTSARPPVVDADCKTCFVFALFQFTARPPVVVAECGTCRILALLCNSQLDRQSSSLCVFQYNLLTSLRLEKRT
jgi:hypothetical protein